MNKMATKFDIISFTHSHGTIGTSLNSTLHISNSEKFSPQEKDTPENILYHNDRDRKDIKIRVRIIEVNIKYNQGRDCRETDTEAYR